MTTYIQSAKKIFELPICWIKKENDQYRLHTFSKGNNLPLIEINEENERILNELGAGYRKVAVSKGFKYEYWDKNVYETEKLTLPTYTFVTDEYKYIGENTFENPTKDTITAALNLELEIKKYLLKDDESVEVYTGDTKDIIKQILNGEASKYIFSMSFEEDEEFETEDGHFYVFPIRKYTGKPSGHVLLFNRRVFYNKVKIKLPKEHAAYIIGRNYCNLVRIAKKMGIKKIKPITDEDK